MAKFHDPLASSNVITAPAEINCQRKVKLTKPLIHSTTKDWSNKLCEKYIDIFREHATNLGKTDLVHMILIPKDNINLQIKTIYITP